MMDTETKKLNNDTSGMKPIDPGTRSHASREIMGFVPHWIIRVGITVVFVIIVVILVVAWFFKYPDIISASVILTAENPPAAIIARSDGKLEALFVKDKQKATNGQWLAIIENTADYRDVMKLEMELKNHENDISDNIFPDIDSIDKHLCLGDIRESYYSFINACNDFQIFTYLDYFPASIEILNKEINLRRTHYKQMINQKELLEKDLQLSRQDFRRDSVLLSNFSISETEFEKRLSVYLNKQFELESFMLELSREKIQLLQIEQRLLDKKLSFKEEAMQVRIKAFEAFENLLSHLELWEQKYVLKSPIDGTITFSTVWNINHNVNAGEKVMTIVPETPSRMIGRMNIPVKGSGKVKPGLEVKIRFANFPSEDFGVVKGKVETISLVPDNDHYLVEVSLPEGLNTTYNKVLDFRAEMQGDAEIITEDTRLLMRIMRPFKALFKNN